VQEEEEEEEEEEVAEQAGREDVVEEHRVSLSLQQYIQHFSYLLCISKNGYTPKSVSDALHFVTIFLFL
jgi:hypothetical protein